MICGIAGLRVKLNNRFAYTSRLCGNYAVSGDEFDVEATVTDAEIEAEKSLSVGCSDGYAENICLYRSLCNRLPLFDRFLLHSSVLTYDGEAYAFSGKSGAGKSTHSALWLKYVEGAEVLNGDKPIFWDNDGEFIAFGTPWNGKENMGRKGSAPLKAICFIEKAETNKIERLNERETASRLFNQILIPDGEKEAVKTLELVDKFIKKVPAYVLYCDISKTAVKTSFEALTGKNF